MTDVSSELDPFERERPRLLAIAYRMLGERMAAEDVVQDAWLRWNGAGQDGIANVQAWLTATTTRLAIDALRKARVRREAYPGPWLPEPWRDALPADPSVRVERVQQADLALLWVMETLKPDERAAFILHDAFDSPYGEIAAILEKSEMACRQLVSRARRKTGAPPARARPVPEAVMGLMSRMMTAYARGDLAAIAALLADDVVAVSDGGGKARAALRVLTGAKETAHVMHALATRKPPARLPDLVWVNGAPALAILDGSPDDVLLTLVPSETVPDRIGWLYVLRNPDKLRVACQAD